VECEAWSNPIEIALVQINLLFARDQKKSEFQLSLTLKSSELLFIFFHNSRI
jgi:hypothetical protein